MIYLVLFIALLAFGLSLDVAFKVQRLKREAKEAHDRIDTFTGRKRIIGG
jgi:hypothetical protein